MTLPTLGVGLALLVGALLGLLGAGGSIVTVPVLVYVVGLDVRHATATSLLIVGLVALGGGAVRRHAVAMRAGLTFGLAGMVGTLPGVWLNHHAPAALVLGGFGATLLLAATHLVRNGDGARRPHGSQQPAAASLAGAGVGVLTGFFGVGGGFLIVPALMFFLDLDLSEAVATSLLVIAMNSIAGLAGHALQGVIAWRIGLEFAVIALAGAMVVMPLGRAVRPEHLQRVFAIMLYALGIGMLGQSLLGVSHG